MAQNVYDRRRSVYVTPIRASVLKYGFLTNVTAAVGTACGHVAVDPENPPTGLAYGVNAPKPGRATRRRFDGHDSTWYDIGQASALRQAGYSLSRPRIRISGGGENSFPVYVTLAGIKYAWRMPVHTYLAAGGDRAALGIQDATSGDRDLVWGADSPKPPKGYKKEENRSISTFVDPQRIDNLPPGWRAVDRDAERDEG
ncbi:MAG: hypothetical protein KME20_13255 [Kaiparowitsia implicata GSE-PSE-MK54-09C]|jgi:hypothetical protein|nr:hypothetical protein [Kaiparowitsia implicata GSE-PSE-MK54-09C]